MKINEIAGQNHEIIPDTEYVYRNGKRYKLEWWSSLDYRIDCYVRLAPEKIRVESQDWGALPSPLSVLNHEIQQVRKMSLDLQDKWAAYIRVAERHNIYSPFLTELLSELKK